MITPDNTLNAKQARTWKSWVPSDAPEPVLLTKAEFMKALADQGVDVNARNLEDWQLKGAIPYPVRRRHDGSTQAMYPEWMLPMVARLKRTLSAGSSLRQLAPVMRTYAPNGVTDHKPTACPHCGKPIG